MNFKRIQSIFLIAFIMIDIFLGYIYVSNNDFKISVQSSNRDDLIVSEMKADSIETGKLSSTRHSGYYISSTGSKVLGTKLTSLKNQKATYRDGELESDFNKPIKIDPTNPTKVLNKVVADKNKILFGSDYVYDAQLSAEYKNDVVYVQKGPGLNVFASEGQIHFRVNSENQIISYTQSYLNDVKTLREKSKVISEKKAVLYLYQHDQIPNNSKLKWAKLGYTKLLSLDDDNAVYIPTWLVAIQVKNSDTIEVKRVNAFTATLLKTENTTITSESSSSN